MSGSIRVLSIAAVHRATASRAARSHRASARSPGRPARRTNRRPFPIDGASSGSVQPMAKMCVASATSAPVIADGFPDGTATPSAFRPSTARTDRSSCGRRAAEGRPERQVPLGGELVEIGGRNHALGRAVLADEHDGRSRPRRHLQRPHEDQRDELNNAHWHTPPRHAAAVRAVDAHRGRVIRNTDPAGGVRATIGRRWLRPPISRSPGPAPFRRCSRERPSSMR